MHIVRCYQNVGLHQLLLLHGSLTVLACVVFHELDTQQAELTTNSLTQNLLD